MSIPSSPESRDTLQVLRVTPAASSSEDTPVSMGPAPPLWVSETAGAGLCPLCLQSFMHLCVCTCMSMCVSVCVYVSVCVPACLYVCLCVCLCVCLSVRVCVSVCGHSSLSLMPSFYRCTSVGSGHELVMTEATSNCAMPPGAHLSNHC